MPEEARAVLKSLQCDRRPALSICSIRVSFGIKETLRLPELIFWNMKTSAYGRRQQQAKKSISLMEHTKWGDIHIYFVLLALSLVLSRTVFMMSALREHSSCV